MLFLMGKWIIVLVHCTNIFQLKLVPVTVNFVKIL